MYDDCVGVDISVVIDVDWCLSVMVKVRGVKEEVPDQVQ